MSQSDFERPVNQKESDAYVGHVRQKATVLYARAEQTLRPRIDAHLDMYQAGIDAIARTHAEIIDRCDLDLGESTRSVAVWDLGGRAISLANALIDQLRRGYASQSIGTMRLMFEAASLLEAFTEAPENVVRKWLDGGHVSVADARKHLITLAERSIEESKQTGNPVPDNPDYQSLVASIEAMPEYEQFMAKRLAQGKALESIAAIVDFLNSGEYDELSHKLGGHNDRDGLMYARDASLRQYFYGPHPDPRVLASYVNDSGHYLQRVVIVVGYALSKFFLGPDYQRNDVAAIQQSFEAVRGTLPLV